MKEQHLFCCTIFQLFYNVSRFLSFWVLSILYNIPDLQFFIDFVISELFRMQENLLVWISFRTNDLTSPEKQKRNCWGFLRVLLGFKYGILINEFLGELTVDLVDGLEIDQLIQNFQRRRYFVDGDDIFKIIQHFDLVGFDFWKIWIGLARYNGTSRTLSDNLKLFRFSENVVQCGFQWFIGVFVYRNIPVKFTMPSIYEALLTKAWTHLLYIIISYFFKYIMKMSSFFFSKITFNYHFYSFRIWFYWTKL